MDSRRQLVNGSWVRSMAPTAPRSETIQNPSAQAITTASGSTVHQGTVGRAAHSAGKLRA